jgi:hypothetical protein
LKILATRVTNNKRSVVLLYVLCVFVVHEKTKCYARRE